MKENTKTTLNKLSEKYDKIMQELRAFRNDKRKRKQNDLKEDTTYLQTERENFSAQIENILERTKMDKLKNIVKGKEYEHKSLILLSSVFSTLGILIDNNWISCNNGIHKTFNLLSLTSLLCLIVAYVFFLIMDKAYKHFFNIPFLLKNFDKDNKKEKLIDFISIVFVLGLIVFSMVTNTIAFKNLGANTTTSIYLGYGIDIVNLICVWFKNKFSSLNGYNSNRPDTENFDKKNEENTQENMQKNFEKSSNLKYVQNTTNSDFTSNLGLNFFSEKNEENAQEKEQKKQAKAGRKMDKRTREKIIKNILALEAGKAITKKSVKYDGYDKMLKALCKELESDNNSIVFSKVGKDGKTRYYKK